MSTQIPDTSNLQPKTTANTLGFKTMLVSWAVTALVMYLNKHHILLPDSIQGQVSDTLASLFDMIAVSISGFLTHKVAAASLARNLANTNAAHALANPQDGMSIGKLVTGQAEGQG